MVFMGGDLLFLRFKQFCAIVLVKYRYSRPILRICNKMQQVRITVPWSSMDVVCGKKWNPPVIGITMQEGPAKFLHHQPIRPPIHRPPKKCKIISPDGKCVRWKETGLKSWSSTLADKNQQLKLTWWTGKYHMCQGLNSLYWGWSSHRYYRILIMGIQTSTIRLMTIPTIGKQWEFRQRKLRTVLKRVTLYTSPILWWGGATHINTKETAKQQPTCYHPASKSYELSAISKWLRELDPSTYFILRDRWFKKNPNWCWILSILNMTSKAQTSPKGFQRIALRH